MVFSVASRQRRRKHEKTQQPADPPPTTGRKRRRRWIVATASLVLLPAALFLLPTIIARTPLLDWIIASATDLDGTIAVRAASLGWFSPVAAEGIQIRDRQDRPVLEAAGLKGDKSLAAILWNMSALGQFQLERPKLTVVLRNDGSNIEDLLAVYLAPSDEPSRSVDVALKIVDGSVSLTDQAGGQTWQIEDLQLAVNVSADASGPLKLDASGTVADAEQPGRFTLKLAMRQPATKAPAPAEDTAEVQAPEENVLAKSASTNAGELSVETGSLPLPMFDSLLRRFAPDTRLAGRLSTKIHAQWDDDIATEGTMAVEADVAADGFALAAPPLGEDELQLQRLLASGRMTWNNGRIDIRQSTLQCDVADLSLSGTLDLGSQQGDMLTSALQQTCQISGRIDLARLAAMLPNTLHVRKETQVTSGHVQLAFSSQPGPQGMVWQGRIEAKDLRAEYLGRQLAWQRPILLTLDVHDSEQGPVVDNLTCESDFLELHAAGTPDELAASASFNLRQLSDQLGQFVDLRGIVLGGDGWARLNWKRSPDRQFATDGELQLRDFHFVIPGEEPWIEESLLVYLSANGRTDLATETQLQQAVVQIVAGVDRIDAQLTQPVLELSSGGTWPLKLTMKGQLQPWITRIGTWITIDGVALAGAYDLAAQVTASTDKITVEQAKLNVAQLQVRSPWINLDEPSAELLFCGSWEGQPRRLKIEPASLTGNDLLLQADQLVLAMPEKGPFELTGTVKYQGEIHRLHQCFIDEKKPPQWRLAGKLDATAQLTQSAGLSDVQVDANVANLLVLLPSGQRFDDPQVHLAARGQYEHANGTLRLDQAQLDCDLINGDLAGQIASTGDRSNLKLDGHIGYDMQKLSGMLRPYIGSGVVIVGKGTGPISYSGPLSAIEARAETAIGWQRADVYGVQVGPGEMRLSLADGVLRARPMTLAVSHGQVSIEPLLRLAPEPMELSLTPGPLATQVQITPQMCASVLKYIAPVLADVTTAEGSFSIVMQGCRIPMAEPANGELAGRLTVHSVQVGPGPLVRELAVLLGRASPATLRRQSTVDFRMVRGRVYHQGLELTFPDLTIRTYGSVGLDQTLAVMAEMPIPPKWLGNNAIGSALRNETIRLPIGGTLSRPKIDRRELDRLSRRFIERAAQNLLENEVGRQLQRLEGILGPPQ